MTARKLDARALLGLIAIVIATGSCIRTSSTFPLTPVDIVDLYPTWSPVDSLIAFYRGVRSSYGPPGVYLIASSGEGVRQVLADRPYPMASLSFSPDGRQLAGIRNDEVVTLDLATNVVTTQLYTANGPIDPDWSPDGSRLVYSRVFLGSGQPADSASLHIIDLATNNDRPVLSGSTQTFGSHPVWSADGSLIAYAGTGIQLIRPDGTGIRTVAGSSEPHCYSPTWIDGGGRLLYGRRSETRVVSVDGTNDRSWGKFYGGMYSLSGDDTYVVFTTQANGRQALVLFTQKASDVLGGSRRQLTQYVP
jgi:Tol biopolymer transport system component